MTESIKRTDEELIALGFVIIDLLEKFKKKGLSRAETLSCISKDMLNKGIEPEDVEMLIKASKQFMDLMSY